MSKNKISVDGDSNIIIQNITNGKVTVEQKIDPSKPEELKRFIKKENKEALALFVNELERNNEKLVNILYSTKKELKLRKKLKIAIITSIVSLVLFSGIISTYFIASNWYSDIFESSPAWIHTMNSNSECEIYKTDGFALSEPIQWFEYKTDSLVPVLGTDDKFSENNDALYYYSKLKVKESWNGFLFSRRYTLQDSHNLLNKKYLQVILKAKNNDRLEVKLKHLYGDEVKLSLDVIAGLAGYRIPLSSFGTIDMSKIQIVLFSHTNSVGSSLENEFYIKHIGFK